MHNTPHDSTVPVTAIFMGTPGFAAHILEECCASSCCSIIGVYTQPDRPAGRGHKVVPSAVKTMAEKHAIPVFQPHNFKDPTSLNPLLELKPDVLLVAAYGLLLPVSVLESTPYGAINVHGSLLPKYRGAAPIQRAIMNGDTTTGITIMQMEKGLDTGPMLSQKALAIGINDTAETLYAELATLGATLLMEYITQLQHNKAPRAIVQDETKASHAAKLSKEESFINWNRPSVAIHAHMRGITPWPGARTTLIISDGSESATSIVQLGSGLLVNETTDITDNISAETAPHIQAPVGTLIKHGNAVCVQCADAPYELGYIKPAGKGMIKAIDFYNGYIANKHARFE